MNALAPLGMVSDLPSENQTNTARREAQPGHDGADERTDYFVQRDGMTFAGTHLLVDLWGASRLDEPAWIDEALREAAIVAGATILHSHFHHFTPNGGVSGVVVLAESHISIHTWPERGSVTIDVYVCNVTTDNRAKGERLYRALERALRPQRTRYHATERGAVDA